MVSRRSTRKRSSSGRVLHMSSPSQYRALEGLIQRGPATLILVFSTTCPHCHTYMPLWKKLCSQKDRQANLVSMRADTYMQTPMASQKPVEGVPSVLRVDKSGQITELDDIRNMQKMSATIAAPAEERLTTTVEPATVAQSVPGTEMSENPLPALPGQRGGNPWAAFLMAAQQAGPAAALLGAYAALPRRHTRRSSGLRAARSRRATQRRRL
jgi:thioredoxin-like negative regulator of GroEL